MTDTIALVGKTMEELEELMVDLKQPSFRAKQIFNWIYNQKVSKIAEMKNLPKDLRKQLQQVAELEEFTVLNRQHSKDKTEKFLFQLTDGEKIETVYLPNQDGRRSLCISSQVGCAMGCNFCATGLQGLSRNLTAGEIVNQILMVERLTKERISNVVLMGMGEPLANYDQVLKAINLMNHDAGLNIGSRRITLSTCGLVPEIKQLADEKLQLTLAISLHAPTDQLRSQMMPINQRYPLDDLLAACDYYTKQTGRRVSFEYALVRGVNDSKDLAQKLASLLTGMLAHVNLIPINQVEQIGYSKPRQEAISSFKMELEKENIAVTVRRERGADIDAACGQLKAKED
ncbi:23S rRNA (adenine(2503)-C(2))-methyltransferase RlmN [Natroniella sulfidigena]|uniref:23S rRNA (adenine(2503)-C(2))-methyltransferase RlmN n=1 Tax=Natroniella sulfidigena TaxID=723921 RepID=UPI00200A0085|nr:23S rRNA (adenine(2503)-C(2))-methyltransferase RlmN [Natroniella sulfidigena]MCK8817817.1 23S rRNA (adenine(2503)-C(2))-methyltransferase RlmN [Natroniella sulfidigena]